MNIHDPIIFFFSSDENQADGQGFMEKLAATIVNNIQVSKPGCDSPFQFLLSYSL